MNISENLLFQMYSMMDSAKLPEVLPSQADKTGSKSNFQDLMDQTHKDVSKNQKPETQKLKNQNYRIIKSLNLQILNTKNQKP